jgi:hypothetical protein
MHNNGRACHIPVGAIRSFGMRYPLTLGLITGTVIAQILMFTVPGLVANVILIVAAFCGETYLEKRQK